MGDWSIGQISIAMTGAFAAGVINALAGNGSVITLTILTEILGLPGTIANGTNRVGVLLNSIGASAGFLGKRQLSYRAYGAYIVPVVLGAVFGTYAAVVVTNGQFMAVFKGLMVVMLIIVLVHPERWLIERPGVSRLPRGWIWPVMLALGFYGGFIQMGMGVFYLAILVLVAKLPLIEANMIKAISIGLFTLVAVVIFAFAGKVIWPIGFLMGVTQFAGGWLSAHFAARIPGAAKLAYGVLVLAVALSVLKVFGIF